MLKLILKTSFVLSLFLLTSCVTVPPDEPICTEITMTRGYCVKIMSGQEFEVNEDNKLNGKTWWEMRPAMIQMPASTWAALKAWIIKSCKGNDKCEKAVANWERTVKIIDDRVEAKLP